MIARGGGEKGKGKESTERTQQHKKHEDPLLAHGTYSSLLSAATATTVRQASSLPQSLHRLRSGGGQRCLVATGVRVVMAGVRVRVVTADVRVVMADV